MRSREETWQSLKEPWDLLVIGGGITGVAILRQAVRLKWKALLVEAGDFASGTSSRSSKLVHGGLRYLKEGRVGLTRESVHERELLLRQAPGLIEPLGFLLANYEGDRMGRVAFTAGLTLYDLLAGSGVHEAHRHIAVEELRRLAPHLRPEGLVGGFWYGDAQTDDARLVLRVLKDAVADGGAALNYAAVQDLLRAGTKNVEGAALRDGLTGRTAEVKARVVVNATGAWADFLRGKIGASPRVRPLRGSHLVFPGWRVPAAQAISFLHPSDGRPLFVIPWEGATVVGTTDLDHKEPLSSPPAITKGELDYLMSALSARLPRLGLDSSDIVSTFCGVRPVVSSPRGDPSKASREHAIFEESGLVSVTGGKLTTFRVIAHQALNLVRRLAPELPHAAHDAVDRMFEMTSAVPGVSFSAGRRLAGRYGVEAESIVSGASPGELEPVAGTPTLWAELRHAAKREWVCHLDDLLLRRARLGLLLPRGGEALLPRVRVVCQTELGWDDERWMKEASAYLETCGREHALPAS